MNTKTEKRIKSNVMDITKGEPTKLLISFAIPMLIGNIFQQVYNLVDSIIVGRFVGSDALAAVGATSSVTFLFFALCNGIGNGGGIVTAQYFGAGNADRIKKALVNAGYIMFAVSLVVAVISFTVAESVLTLMGTPQDIMADAVIYMKVQSISVPLMGLYNYSAAMLRALGDSKTPLYFLLFSCALNAGLDLWFVCGLGMGVFGAALATAIAQLIAGVSCLIFAVKSNPYFHLEKRHFKLEKTMMWECARLGVPLSLQFALIAISCMALQRVVNSFGATAVAAFTTTSRIEQLVQQPYGSLGMAISTYAGQNIGANRMDRVKLGYKKSLFIVAVFSLIMLPVIQFGGSYVVGLFVEDAEVIRLGTTAVKITSWFYLFLGMIYATRGILNGVGDATFAFMNGIVEMVSRVTIPAALTMIPFIGVWGIWWSTGITWFLSALFSVLRYLQWRKKRSKITT